MLSYTFIASFVKRSQYDSESLFKNFGESSNVKNANALGRGSGGVYGTTSRISTEGVGGGRGFIEVSAKGLRYEPFGDVMLVWNSLNAFKVSPCLMYVCVMLAISVRDLASSSPTFSRPLFTLNR